MYHAAVRNHADVTVYRPSGGKQRRNIKKDIRYLRNTKTREREF